MKIACQITITYPSEKQVKKLLQSLEVDDESYVQTQQKNNQLKVSISANTLSSLIHSLDDYLACLSIAEKIVNKD
ncbi:MAG: hypothetical protein KKC68_06045 [Candidatus Thermoplasmatota archaeon]|nr:hypothetical protein [Candidatus Thermoplasmatota archaeon]MBU1941318.1 hypothetical protein [Candidatus Thermoplasmatota archaeon]